MRFNIREIDQSESVKFFDIVHESTFVLNSRWYTMYISKIFLESSDDESTFMVDVRSVCAHSDESTFMLDVRSC